MNDLIDDQQQRLQAISAEHSCIVRAPAGSGKTELLIQRYLRLLSLVDNPEEIVAITFTRKAANEMQTRILSALSLAASATPPQDEHRQHTWHLAQAALKRDAQSGWQLQQNPARMKILTIDALCANLVKRAPVLSGLGARVETVEDAQPLYEQAATMALNELEKDNVWSDSIARLLDHLDNDLPRVKRLLTGMLGKRDQWLSHVIDTPQREQLEAALQTVITEKLSQLRTRLPTELETELCEVAAFAALNLQQSNPEHDTANCHFITEYPAEDIEHVPQWLGLSELLLTKSGTWRKQHRVSEGFPAPSDNKAEKEIRSAMKKRVLAVIQQLQQIHGVDLLFNDVRALPPATFTDAEWDVITALCVMLKLAAGQLNLLFSERSQTDFTGVAEAALQALGDDELPTDLALLLDYKLKHLLYM